jgi:hypothetical protein
MDHPNKVELKISLTAGDVSAARQELGLLDDGATTASIWFCEQVARSIRRMPLSERGVIVRVRDKGADSDTTVKYRRPDPIQLPTGWDDPDGHPDYKIEGDWTGANHQVSASLDSTVTSAVVAKAMTGGSPLDSALFSADQRAFANALLPPSGLTLTSLHPLGPIHALRWNEEVKPGFDDPIGAEQWTADDLVFLELSIRVKYAHAKERQQAFLEWATTKHLKVDAVGSTKTQAILEHFATRRTP